MSPRLHAVILAGGPGRRFWPWSTPKSPKHALPLLPRGRSLFEETVSRLRRLVPPERLWLVTTAEQAGTLRRLAPSLRRNRIIVEPEARDTAAAIGVAAAGILALDPEAVMAVCPADHAICPSERFVRQLRQASALASRRDLLITFGIRPDRPATTYGYIEPGPRAEGRFRYVSAFREKPALPLARRLVRAGCLWNSGIFAWKAGVLLAALARHAPALARELARLPMPLSRLYPSLPKLSIDYAVMEAADNVAVLPADFAWSDWGTWTAWETSLKPDRNGNRIFGKARLEHCRDTTVVNALRRRSLSVSGTEGHLVVQAPAGILVCLRSQAEDLKNLLKGTA